MRTIQDKQLVTNARQPMRLDVVLPVRRIGIDKYTMHAHSCSLTAKSNYLPEMQKPRNGSKHSKGQ